MPEIEYEGVPRNKISWDPKIDHNKCITCGKCVDFCHMNAKFEEKNGKKRIVVNPNSCVVFLSRLRRYLSSRRHFSS